MQSGNSLSRDKKHLLNILFMYLISQGESPKRAKVSYLYPFYAKILNKDIPEKDRFIWLMQLARVLEKNIHKTFELKKELFK